ncbi:MAG: trypsin-like peptidase domain-containing protein [Verrucomicrobiota bacterium]
MSPKLPTSLALIASLLLLAGTLAWAVGWLNAAPVASTSPVVITPTPASPPLAVLSPQAQEAAAAPSASLRPPVPTPGSVAAKPEHEPVVRAVGSTLPTVVNIHTEHVVERYFTTPYHAYFGKYYKQQEKVKSLGSGMLVSADGYIVTNHHVVQLADEMRISVTLHNGDDRKYEARFVRSEPSLDLALIKVDLERELPYFDLARLSPNLLGQTVIALGNPVGYSSSVSRGILSAKDREFEGDGVRMTGLVQTDAAINPGNSGGPLVDIEGKLVGINTAKFASVAVEGIGFAVPGEVVAPWVREAMAVSNGQRPDPQPQRIASLLRERLGLVLEDVGDRLSRYYGSRPVAGAVISQVLPNSAASRAGLQPGMVVTEIDGERFNDTAQLPRSLLGLRPGQGVQLTLVEFRSQGTSLLQRRVGARLRAQ